MPAPAAAPSTGCSADSASTRICRSTPSATTSLAEGNPQEGFAFQIQDSTSYAFFGSLDFQLSAKWDLVAGLRYSDDERDFYGASGPDAAFQTPTSTRSPRAVEDDNVSWNLSLTYAANPNVNIYGRLATGYRAPSIQGRILFCADFEGGTNPATNCVTVADSEEIISAELGLRTILAQNKLRFNLTGYYFEMDGQQVSAVGGEYNIATLLNVDKTEGYGFETDIEWTPSGHFLTTFGLSYNPTEIKDPNLTVAPCGGGCTVTRPSDRRARLHRRQQPAPRAGLDLQRHHQLRGRHRSTRGFFASWTGPTTRRSSSCCMSRRSSRPTASRSASALGYALASGKYEVALFGRNIFDEKIIRGGIDFNNLTGMMNDPRIIGAELVLHF